MKTLLMMSLTGGAMALLVMLLRAVLGHKLHPRMIYLLWLPVLLALIIPIRFESPISLRSAPAVQYVEHTVTARMDEPLTFTQPQTPDASHISTDTSIAVGTAPDGTLNVDVEETTRETTPAKVTLDAWDIVAIVWAAGALLTGGYVAIVNLRFRARVRRSRKPVDVPWIVARQMGDTRVFVSKVVPSPCLIGLFRPFIVVTPQAMEEENRLIHVLTHERMHKLQLDPLWSRLRMAVLVLHWFNPIVWIAASFSRADCENSCDALTIRTLGEEQRVDYGKTLLSFLRAKPTATALVNAATTMAQSRRQIRRRISLIAKKQRYAWLAAALAVTLTLTGCALTMTAPADDASDPASVYETPAPVEQGSDTVAPTPTPAPVESLEYELQDDALREFAARFEQALEPYVKEFYSWEHGPSIDLPELAESDLLYSRRNEDGDAYILAKLPEVQKASTYYDIHLNVWQETEEGDELTYVIERIGVLGEPGNFTEVKLNEYKLTDVLLVDAIEGIENTLIVIPEDSDHIMCSLHTVSAINTELFIRNTYPGATSIMPKQGAYLSVPLLSAETMQATGWSTAITAYLPVKEDLLAGLEFTPIDQKRMKDFWEDTVCMSLMRLHLDDKTSVYIGSDRLVKYEDYMPVSACVQPVYYERFNGIIEDIFGIDPFFYIYSKAYQSPKQVDVLSASLTMIDYQTGEILSGATTDGENLEKLKNLVFKPDDILVGGAGCPFGGILKLQTTSGEFTFHVASDSCGVLCYEGNVYIDYGDQADLFEIFPACDPDARMNTAADTGALDAMPKTLEILPAGASQWDIYEADAQVQELFNFLINKVESGESDPADEITEILYELDFRAADTARLLKVEVGPGFFVYDDRTYPDKKREVITLIDALKAGQNTSSDAIDRATLQFTRVINGELQYDEVDLSYNIDIYKDYLSDLELVREGTAGCMLGVAFSFGSSVYRLMIDRWGECQGLYSMTENKSYRQQELEEIMVGVTEDKFGNSPLYWPGSGALNANKPVRATLEYPGKKGMLTQTISSTEDLGELYRLVFKYPTYIGYYEYAQNRKYDATLTIYCGDNGESIRKLYISTDGSAIMASENAAFMVIEGGEEALFDLFPECAPA